jgi:hypothetical protein
MATVMAAPRTIGATLKDVPRNDRIVVFILAFFAGWPALKVANVQLLEMFMMGHLAWLMLKFCMNGFTARLRGLWIRPGIFYGVVMLAILLTSLSSIRMQRYPVEGPYFLHYPMMVVVLRYLELFLVVFYSLYMAEKLRRSAVLRDYALKTYLNSALITSCLTLGGWVLWKGTHKAFFVTSDGRGTGEFPEGGPWGLFLLTVAIVAWILWKRRLISRQKWYFSLYVLGTSFYLCKSKACALCALTIFITQIFFGHNLKQKIASIVLLAGTFGAIWYTFDVPGLVRMFSTLQQEAEILVALNPLDANVAYGRVAGSVIVPRMIARHPITGIGMGNYPVMRNDPAYLGIMYPDHFYDLPGLGLLWVAAELGIPLLIALYGMMLYPAFRVSRAHGNPLLLTLALCQPYVHLMGCEITWYYPWLASAFVLSFLPLPAALAARTAPTALVAPAGSGMRMRTSA